MVASSSSNPISAADAPRWSGDPSAVTALLDELRRRGRNEPLRVELWAGELGSLGDVIEKVESGGRVEVRARTPRGRDEGRIDPTRPFASVVPGRDAAIAWGLTVDRASIGPLVDALSACGGEILVCLRPLEGTRGDALAAWRMTFAHAVSEAGGAVEYVGWAASGLEAYRVRRMMTCPLMVHVHVPKCGGQSIHKHLWDTWGDQRFFYLQPFHVSSTATVERWLSQHPEVDAISSHTFIRSHPKRLAGRTCLYVTTLRHPVRQLISFVRYVKQNYETFPQQFKKHLPEGASQIAPHDLARAMMFADTYGFQQVLASWYLAIRQRYTPLMTALLDRYTLVGITEHMDLSLRMLRERLKPYGLDLPAPDEAPRVNRSVRGSSDEELALERQIRRYLDEHYPAEIPLYQWARARFKEDVAVTLGDEAAASIDLTEGNDLGLRA